MTPSRYRRSLLLRAFGYNPKLKRLGEASSELHLLQDAEEILGAQCWENCEPIEALGVEYWNLKKLAKTHTELVSKMSDGEDVLQKTQEERTGNISQIQEQNLTLEEKKARFAEQTNTLDLQRQEIIRKAGDIKREHDALKAKITFLRQEGKIDSDKVEEAKEKLKDFRTRHRALKAKRLEVVEKINTVEDQLDLVSKELVKRRESLHEEASGTYQNIGQTNRDLSDNRRKLGAVNEEMAALYRHIGSYLSSNFKNPECSQAFRQHRALVRKMSALRQSILYNHILAER